MGDFNAMLLNERHGMQMSPKTARVGSSRIELEMLPLWEICSMQLYIHME
jgi:hypothetical protein